MLWTPLNDCKANGDTLYLCFMLNFNYEVIIKKLDDCFIVSYFKGDWVRALFQHDTLITGIVMRSADQRRNSVVSGDAAHKRTLKDELQWLHTLCHRLGVTHACNTSELLQLQCCKGYAMKKCVPGVKYMPTDAMPTACVGYCLSTF